MSITQDRITKLEQQLKNAKAKAAEAAEAKVTKLKAKRDKKSVQFDSVSQRCAELQTKALDLADELDRIDEEIAKLTGSDDDSSN